jgi:hypothetical protein
MNSKRPELSAGLVAVKGRAVPASDMPTRTTETSPARSVATSAEAKQGKEALMPLNFRVPASFRREFKTYAARHDMKLNELLRRCFETYSKQQGE